MKGVMKAQRTIKDELARLRRLQENSGLSERGRQDVYALRQALEWVLGYDVMAPARYVAINNEQ